MKDSKCMTMLFIAIPNFNFIPKIFSFPIMKGSKSMTMLLIAIPNFNFIRKIFTFPIPLELFFY
jgi:hypothetical protein